jgi:hypothetical protein
MLDALKNNEIDPAKLADMTSAERRDFFTKIVGEDDAKDVNALFESKLLLKNQQTGLLELVRNWRRFPMRGVASPRPNVPINTIIRKGVSPPIRARGFINIKAPARTGAFA